MNIRTALAAVPASLAVLIPALPVVATTKPAPLVGATINVAAIPGAGGAYQVTLLQVYNNLRYVYEATYAKRSPSHPLVARLRVSDTGATSVHENPQRDADGLLLGQDYPTWPVVVLHSYGHYEWQLAADAYSNYEANANVGVAGQFSEPPGTPTGCGLACTSPGTCPTPTVPVPGTIWARDNMAGGGTTVNAYGDINLIPGSAAETCVVFSLPVKVDRMTLKVCWTPDAAAQLQQPTYCWLVDNDTRGAI